MNHINLGGINAFLEEVKGDPSKAKKSKQVECSWNFNQGNPQIESRVLHASGESILQSDFAPFMGGEGLAPDPIQYCLFGLAACFAGTFMSTATVNPIPLETELIKRGNKKNML